MPDPNVSSQSVRRDVLSSLFGGNHRMVKAWEDMTQSTTVDIPIEIAKAQATADNALSLAGADALGVFGRQNQSTMLDVRPGDFIVVTRDAQGFIVGVDLVPLVIAMETFLTRQLQNIPPANDSQNILVNRIFGR